MQLVIAVAMHAVYLAMTFSVDCNLHSEHKIAFSLLNIPIIILHQNRTNQTKSQEVTFSRKSHKAYVQLVPVLCRAFQ